MTRNDTSALYNFLDSTGGMSKHTARALAAVTLVCQSTTRVSDPVRRYLNHYRVAAIIDRERFSRRVREIRGPWYKTSRPTYIDAAVAVVCQDYEQLNGAGTSRGLALSIRSNMIDNASATAAAYGATARTLVAYANAELNVSFRPSMTVVTEALGDSLRVGTPVVRMKELSSAMNLAQAEFYIQTCPDTVLDRGRDINLDTAVAGYFHRGGDFTLDYLPGCRLNHPNHALLVGVGRALGAPVDRLTIPSMHLLEDTVGHDQMWLTTRTAPHTRGVVVGEVANDALMTRTGVHYLLDRVYDMVYPHLFKPARRQG